MKKNYIFIFVFSLFSLTVIGQPTVTYSGNCPQVGDHFYQALFTGNIVPGPAGANQTWDFSGITSNDGNNAIYVLAPADTPYGDYYPDANIAFNYNNDDTYSYGFTSPAELLNLGTASLQNSMEVIIHYEDPARMMKYPFNYNDTYDDTYSGSYDNGTLVVHQSGNVNSLADAWGSISTPYGIYSNTLRVKTHITEIDSAWMSGNFVYASTVVHTNYEWYDPDIHTPIFSINISESNGVADTTGSYQTSPQSVSETGNSLNNIIVFPNPATDNVTILFKTDHSGPVIITINDLSGREMKHLTKNITVAGTQNIRLKLESFKAGIYIVNINDGQETYNRKLIIR